MMSVSRRLVALVPTWHGVLLCIWCLGFVDASALAATRALDVSAAAPSATGPGPVTLAPYFDALEDPGHQLTIADLRGTTAVPSAAWRAVSAPEVNYGYSKSSYWLRLHLRNTGDAAVERMLELGHWGIERIEFHQITVDGEIRSLVTGSLTPFATRPYANRYFVFPVTVAARSEQWLYLRVRSTPVIVPAVLWKPADFHAHERNDYIAQALFFGSAIALLIYNLLLYVGTRIAVYLWYIVFVACTTLTLADQNGLAKEFLWPDATTWSAISVNVGYSLSLATVLLFMRQMLNTQRVAPRLDRVIQVVAAIHLMSPLGFALAFDALAEPATTLYAGTAAFILASSLWLVLQRQRPAYFFFAAFFMSLFGTVMLALRAFAVVPSNVFTVNGTQFGSAVEMLLLAFALADRLNEARREKLDAQREVLQAQTELVQSLKSSEQVLEASVQQRTEELVSARDEADQASRAKSVFLAKVSHELRTPMHTLLGYLDLALREPLPSAAARQLEAARGAGQELISQVNDLLEHARGEHAMLRLAPVALALQSLAQRLRDRLALLERDSGNRFELVCDSRLPPWVWADGHRIEQVLMALLNNAMRYTRAGQVTLRITLLEAPAPGAPDPAAAEPAESPLALRFEVEDTGRGISPPALARLFQAFERGESSDADGLGLGLSISQQLLALMASRLEVTSQSGLGSSFAFTLRLRLADEREALIAAPDASPLAAFTAYEGRTRRVLVLDDEPASRRLLEELLGDLGFEVRAFGDLASALAFVQAELQAGEPGPDLCIVDQHLGRATQSSSGGPQAGLPEHQQSGWDFIRALRERLAQPRPWTADCQVLMLSATEAHPPDGWATERGVDRHLLKPAEPQRLLVTIGEMLGLQWVRAPSANVAGPAAGVTPGPAAAVAAFGESDGQAAGGAWQSLEALADAGSLSGLEDWQAAHPGLVAADGRLQALVLALDFGGIARHSRAAQGL